MIARNYFCVLMFSNYSINTKEINYFNLKY